MVECVCCTVYPDFCQCSCIFFFFCFTSCLVWPFFIQLDLWQLVDKTLLNCCCWKSSSWIFKKWTQIRCGSLPPVFNNSCFLLLCRSIENIHHRHLLVWHAHYTSLGNCTREKKREKNEKKKTTCVQADKVRAKRPSFFSKRFQHTAPAGRSYLKPTWKWKIKTVQCHFNP